MAKARLTVWLIGSDCAAMHESLPGSLNLAMHSVIKHQHGLVGFRSRL